MPVIKIVKINEKSTYALWDITESLDELMALAKNTSNVQLPDNDVTNEVKKKEWLAGRLLLSSLVGELGAEYQGIYKDEYGKPFLNNLDYHVSISHSSPFVAVIVSDKRVGLDIEQPKDKLLRIARKFLSDEEYAFCGDDVEKLCIHWCAKEALYKLYGKKKLLFKENLAVKYVGNHLTGKVIVNGSVTRYELIVEKYRESILVYTI